MSVPTYREVVKRFKDRAEELRIKSQESSGEPLLLETKVKQGFTKLLLVPFGMLLGTAKKDPRDPKQEKHIYTGIFKIYTDLLTKHFREGKLYRTKKNPYATDEEEPAVPIETMDVNRPLWTWEMNNLDLHGLIFYYPRRLNQSKRKYQGQTKKEILKNNPASAWQILLVEDLPNLPTPQTAQTINGRTQLDNQGTSIKQYLADLKQGPNPDDYIKALNIAPMYRGEQGLTPEAWFMLACLYLEKINQIIEDYRGAGRSAYLLGAYYMNLREVFSTGWEIDSGRVYFSGRRDSTNNSIDVPRVCIKI